MKIYVEPDIAMVQQLVLKIQQEIKKQPLTRSDTLAKLGDVIKRRLDEYHAPGSGPRTEAGFLAAQPKQDQAEVVLQYYQELQRLVFFDPENRLADAVRPGKKDAPTTDKVLINKIIKPLLHLKLLTSDMDNGPERDNERELILLVLNAIHASMLPEGWINDKLQRRRTQNFFYQGSIAWWLNVCLIPALRYVTIRIQESIPLFVGPLEQEHRDAMIEVVQQLCEWPLWSTEDEDDLKAMRSNTLGVVTERFATHGYDARRLISEYQKS
jgi:hypothetical protein